MPRTTGFDICSDSRPIRRWPSGVFARYRRLVERRGHIKALVAIACSILVIVWHLINDLTTRFRDLGADHYQRHTDPAPKARDLIRQLQALGHEVMLTPATA